MPKTFVNLSALDGANGFKINGIEWYDRNGFSVSSAGDVNGDGFDDIIIGAPFANSYAEVETGESYVLFGSANWSLSNVDLSSLDGNNGFQIIDGDFTNSASDIELSGYSVSSAGDVNGDGIDDIIIGAPRQDQGSNYDAGASYVVFGSTNWSLAELDLSSLDGSNGFQVTGINSNDFSGQSVSSAGDVNGDGVDDIIIGAHAADPNGNLESGASYVVFGSQNWSLAELDLSSLDGSNGFQIRGIDANDSSGGSVSSAGDFNGDGIDDIIIGAMGADPDGKTSAGESYVVFGSNTRKAADLDLSSLDGTSGFKINGIDANDFSGSVSSAGDFNGDGVDDIIVGARGADGTYYLNSGESYVVFGSTDWSLAELDLSSLDGSNGFQISGRDGEHYAFGGSVSSAGDVNGDGVDDIIIGASGTDANAEYNTGASYVVFGSTDWSLARLSGYSLNGSNGFQIRGIDANDFSGGSVSSAGDVNGDGFDDIIIGASRAGDPLFRRNDAGESYVVFGARLNDTPVVTSSAVTSINEDASYSYTLTASDVDAGDTVTLSAQTKPDWLSFDAGTGVLSGTPTNDAVGDHSVVLRATDGANAYVEQSFTVSVSNVNDDPVVTSSAVTSINEDASYSYTLTASD
ncbi:putative Ig domain-containing protein, partial [Lentibacter algarum]|uniref:putative Ig domain-containing protein n=1 Tax=Lentibacter algarum TaxID=576131 RepID=UPI00248F7027